MGHPPFVTSSASLKRVPSSFHVVPEMFRLSVPEMEGICHWGASFFEDVPLVELIYLVFTRTPGGVTVGDSGLCCRVPCLSSTITSLLLLIFDQITARMKQDTFGEMHRSNWQHQRMQKSCL